MSAQRIATNLRALLLPSRGWALFVASLLFWNPVIAAAITFVLGGTRHFFQDWLISLAIAQVVAVECHLAVRIVRHLEISIHRLRGRAAPVHSTGWYLLLACLMMPLALPLGFAGGGVTARALGLRWGAPDFGSYRIGIGFGLVMAALFFFQHSRAEAREAARAAELRIKDLDAARLQAQLAALTAEMNPHLLFNALNTVAALIPRDPERAEDVVLQLSEMYRGVLRASGSATHSLEEELNLCEAYLNVEKARFGDRLDVRFDVDPALDARAFEVPVLIAQPFVENAVKHGVSTRARGGRVSVTVRRAAERVELAVEDDGVGLGNSPHKGTGRAMANCRERLKLTYGDRAALDVTEPPGGGARVVIAVPTDAKGSAS